MQISGKMTPPNVPIIVQFRLPTGGGWAQACSLGTGAACITASESFSGVHLRRAGVDVEFNRAELYPEETGRYPAAQGPVAFAATAHTQKAAR